MKFKITPADFEPILKRAFQMSSHELESRHKSAGRVRLKTTFASRLPKALPDPDFSPSRGERFPCIVVKWWAVLACSTGFPLTPLSL